MVLDQVIIEQATEADIPFLAEYRHAMFVEMFPETDWSAGKAEFLASAERYYSGKMDGRDEVSLVARQGKTAVGCGTIMFQARPPHVKNHTSIFGYILNIYVTPNYRNQGVASLLMRALEAEAARRGVKRIGLHASAAGAPVYSKLGYVTKPSYMEHEIQ
jgi:ribosomal protein S18 acetylase RimI-like enzyme